MMHCGLSDRWRQCHNVQPLHACVTTSICGTTFHTILYVQYVNSVHSRGHILPYNRSCFNLDQLYIYESLQVPVKF